MLKVLLFTLWSFTAVAQTHVLVSVAPQKYLVERIGKERVTVDVIVPDGISPHTYEPSPRQLVSMQKGEIWFRLGEGFEKRLMNALSRRTQIVDQREGLELLNASCGCDGADPHTWLSPRLLTLQSRQIAATLCSYDPNHTDFYKKNLRQLEKELFRLDRELSTALKDAPKTILVSHPAYGYLCRDYGLMQLSVEKEGREPTPRYLTELTFKARDSGIKTVFLQKQYSAKGAKRIASDLGAECVYLDPYAENVIVNLKEIAQAFRQ